MKFGKIKILGISFILTFVLALNSVAQVVVERSKDKIIISGTQYYMHQVKKGETAYSISRAYGITVDELNRENPQAVKGLKEGQTLRILASEVKDVAETKTAEPSKPVVKRDESKFV